MMTHRQRAKIALIGGIADYVPTFELAFFETEHDFDGRIFYGTDFAPADKCGLNRNQIYRHNAKLYIDIARKFEHSIIYVTPLNWPYSRHYNDVVEMIKIIRDLTGDEYFVCAPGDPTFKIPSDPMEFSVRMYEAPESLKQQAQKELDMIIPSYDLVKSAGTDGIILTRDYAMNDRSFFSPDMFAEFIQPYLTKAIMEIHSRDMIAIKHTDGNIKDIIEQIIEAKPDALHSIDPQAGMDIREVKEKYSDKVALCGNVNCGLMQTGTKQQIKESAEYCLKYGKPNGGYVFSTSNCVFRGMPIESYHLINDIWKQQRYY